jgi:hypothetical protein
VRLTVVGRIVLVVVFGAAVVAVAIGIAVWGGERTGERLAAGESAPSTPIRLQIPVAAMGLQADGSLEVPTETDEAGWWSGGSAPGLPGPTVLVAHRDSLTGPALFSQLPYLQRGDPVLVTDKAGEVHEFVIVRIERHPRDQFPTGAVYGRTPRSTLRLLTCGGDYDRNSGYADNYIVFATAA